MTHLVRIFIFAFFIFSLAAHADDRIDTLRTKLEKLSKSAAPGLKETVDFSVSGISIQEFLRGLAESNSLNISIDPTLNIRIVNNFTNEQVLEIFIFLCKEYQLDITFTGSIMSFKAYNPPAPKVASLPVKDILISYNAYSDLLSLDLKQDTLEKVVKKITNLTKKNLIIPASLSNRLVSIYIENMPYENAVDKLAFSNSLKMNKTKDNFYVLENLEQDNTQNPSARSKTNYLNKDSQYNNENLSIEISSDSLGHQFINLEAVNNPISDIIKAISKELKVNFFMFSEPKGSTTTKITRATYDEVLNFLFQGTEHTYKKIDNIYLFGERSLEGLRATRLIQLQYRSAETILDNIPAELKKGVDIKHFKELNSLILSGSEPRIYEIESFVKQLDKIVPMILIEVLIVNVSKSRTVKTGISAGLDSTRRTSGGSVFPGLDYTLSSRSINRLLADLGLSNNIFNLGRVTPNFYINLRALEEQGNINIQQTPKLSTLNSHEATLKIGQTRYYELATQNVQGSLTTNVTRTVQYNQIQANLSIKINPTVSGDDQVTLEIDVDNSDFTEIPPAGPPPTSTSAFKSIIRVKNEEMVVLGGLERVEKRETGSGVPLLSRIPILKWIFSSKSRTKAKSKQLIFIRPTIMY